MNTKLAVWSIMLGVAAWGIFHAVGAYTFNHNAARATVVVGCSAAFLGFWALMLAFRKPRPPRWSKNPLADPSVKD